MSEEDWCGQKLGNTFVRIWSDWISEYGFLLCLLAFKRRWHV